MSKTAFVGNLSFSATEEELTQLFSEAGPVVRARIGMDRETGRSRGFAFVEFGSEEACQDAIQRLNGHEMGGRRLRVNDADDKPPPRGPRPPGGGYRTDAPVPPRPGMGDRFHPRAALPPEPPPIDLFSGDRPPEGGTDSEFRKRVSGKGSRRRLRARKRSLWG